MNITNYQSFYFACEAIVVVASVTVLALNVLVQIGRPRVDFPADRAFVRCLVEMAAQVILELA